MEIRDIYIFICMCSFFYGTFTRASTNNLDSVMNSTFHAGRSRGREGGNRREKPDRMSRGKKKEGANKNNNQYFCLARSPIQCCAFPSTIHSVCFACQ